MAFFIVLISSVSTTFMLKCPFYRIFFGLMNFGPDAEPDYILKSYLCSMLRFLTQRGLHVILSGREIQNGIFGSFIMKYMVVKLKSEENGSIRSQNIGPKTIKGHFNIFNRALAIAGKPRTQFINSVCLSSPYLCTWSSEASPL